MRHIKKSAAPAAFNAYKGCNGATYKNFVANQPLYNEVKQQLIGDQLGQCCYCGIRVELDSTHIEHVLDQNKHKKLQLEFSNLLASCNGGPRQEHCGHAKGSRPLPVTPLQDDCEERFVFRSNGYVASVEDDQDADTSIDVLNLNIVKLRNMRKAALSGSGLFEDDLKLEDIEEYIELYNSADDNGQLEPFSQVVVNRLRQEQALLLQAERVSG
ncbi:TIGR02646 family protein [Endozoicomonas gorgoniicola]|uniref:TIGR02646 family protein n=1 Tax=Endozoicomonas gorgoniicola TaxID=1234144 RepID=A0ABT3MU05_9GAMM|nr:retron system putative HNH endonuclease [Endozoicomonas gorgoniicola]MCW7552860.1 TIGR02646 family protein [Endozoicomonas gorgoniicola]